MACEDPLSEAFCIQFMKYYFPTSTYNPVIVTGGVGELKKKVEAFKNIAQIPDKATLIVTDLDENKSVESLRQEWSGKINSPQNFLLLVAVKEIESWVLADIEAFSKWSGIPANKFPVNPDHEKDAKQILLNLVRKYANNETKRNLLPDKGVRSSRVGIAYNISLRNFVNDYWCLNRALVISESLREVDNLLSMFSKKI